MDLYTTYFANLGDLPETILPISICGKAPEWYKGIQYKKLAPKYDFFMKWKETHDNEYYIKCFNEQVLAPISCCEVYEDLMNRKTLAEIKDEKHYDGVALVCYETPDKFCHRHLVAGWFAKNGYEISEYDKLNLKSK